MVEDKELIRQYVATGSEAAFSQLVNRHLKMVYASALRQVHGDFQLAEDIAQLVFATLARKAPSLKGHESVAGWLYASTRFTAANIVRAETRRRTREQVSLAMNDTVSNPESDWSEINPVIDEALSKLGKMDREAIVLRFFEDRDFGAIGALLGISESGARMRVERALEKARGLLVQRGLTASEAGLAGALTASMAVVVPPHLAAGVTKAAATQAAAGSLTTSILKIIAMKKITFVAAGIVAVALVSTVTLTKLRDGANRGVHSIQTYNVSAYEVLAPGETLLAGSWPAADGLRRIALITPEWIDAAGNLVPSPQGQKPQTTISAQFVEAPEAELAKLGLIKTGSAAPVRTLLKKYSSSDASAMISALERESSATVLSTPRVTTAVNQLCSITTGQTVYIDGREQQTGLTMELTPRVAPDGQSFSLKASITDRVPR